VHRLRRLRRFSFSDGTTSSILRLFVHANGLLLEFIIVVMNLGRGDSAFYRLYCAYVRNFSCVRTQLELVVLQ
jgi:hypothetical protein